MLGRLAKEPPFRILARAILKRVPVSVETRALWELSERPQYLVGVLAGAREARRHGIDEICVAEFGVAGGTGLLALEEAAAAVEREAGVRIKVYGFDNGPSGLPPGTGDYRDHPDWWKPGDFPMDVEKLKRRLTPRTQLILGDVAETVDRFVEEVQDAPLGFASFDLDLYSSTRAALRIISHEKRRILMNVPLYFDDIAFLVNHRFAGELLAIEEFNEEGNVKIDRWYGIRNNRPFPERPFLERMYVAHDLDAITRCSLSRANVRLDLKSSSPLIELEPRLRKRDGRARGIQTSRLRK